jgi:hypothetical protein
MRVCCHAGKLTLSLSQQAAAWAQSKEHAEVLLVVGGRLLIDWLLTTASRDDGSPEQANAERALLSLLHTRAMLAQNCSHTPCTASSPGHRHHSVCCISGCCTATLAWGHGGGPVEQSDVLSADAGGNELRIIVLLPLPVEQLDILSDDVQEDMS